MDVRGPVSGASASLGRQPADAIRRLASHDRLPFVRAQSCGNDFVIIDHRSDPLGDMAEPLAQLLCRRGVSEGADGLLLIEAPLDPRCTVRMRLINPDGSEGEMCGNGALVFAQVTSERLGAGRSFSIETIGGVVEARVFDDRVGIALGHVSVDVNDHELEVLGHRLTVHGLDIYDLPHAVVVVPDDPIGVDSELDLLGRAIRHHPTFPRGTNVDFIHAPGGDRLAVRTFERGVDRATLSCGTGAIAATIIGQRLGLGRAVAVRSLGGTLDVSLERGDGWHVTLNGRPRIIADGHLLPGAWTQ